MDKDKMYELWINSEKEAKNDAVRILMQGLQASGALHQNS